MKPQPKPELEQVLEAEEFVAEQEALAEVEAKQLLSQRPYRTPDLSYLLAIPRDVKGLVELLEEKNGMEEEIKKLNITDPDIYTPVGGGLGTIGTYVAMLVLGSSLHGSDHSIILSLFLLSPTLGGVLTGYLLSRRRQRENRKQRQQKEKEYAPLIKAINQKLSHFEKNYRKGDFVLVDDNELGYSLGEIYQLEDRLQLRQWYSKREGNKTDSITRHRDIDEKDIISFLKPHRELSEDDLRELSNLSDRTSVVTKYPSGSVSG